MTSEAITFETVRELGLELPRAQASRYYGMPALKVGGNVFVVQTNHRSAEPNSISAVVGFPHRDKLIARDPRVFYVKRHYMPYPVVLARLNCITRDALGELLREAHHAVSSGAVSVANSRRPRALRVPPKKVRRARSSAEKKD
jgi:hypothetical protein